MEINARMNYDLMYQFRIEMTNRFIMNNFFARFFGITYCLMILNALVTLFILLFLPHSADLKVDYFVILVIPFVVLLDQLRKKKVKIQTEQMFKEFGASYIFSKHIITDEGIEIQDNANTRNLSWNELNRFEIYKNFFVFYITPTECTVIPKQSMSEKSADELLRLVRSNLPKKKIKK